MNAKQAEAAVWYQVDAEYLYRTARQYRDVGNDWMAQKVQDNAAHSARLAREIMHAEAAA